MHSQRPKNKVKTCNQHNLAVLGHLRLIFGGLPHTAGAESAVLVAGCTTLSTRPQYPRALLGAKHLKVHLQNAEPYKLHL